MTVQDFFSKQKNPLHQKADLMQLDRRKLLRAAGVSLALPCFDAFSARGADAEQSRRRMVCICTPLGLHPDNFIPKEAGKDYALTPYLETIKDYRDDLTVVSGLSHPGVSPGFGHQATATFLTGVPGADRGRDSCYQPPPAQIRT
jgi:hypothetical protein